jgi:hypothetical protein
MSRVPVSTKRADDHTRQRDTSKLVRLSKTSVAGWCDRFSILSRHAQFLDHAGQPPNDFLAYIMEF